MKKIEAFTDGACRGNPGPGGWGAVLRYNGKEKLLKGAAEETTNNKMELSAAIGALANLKEPCHVILTTDSTYVKDGITKWIHNWKKNGWRASNRKPVKNVELWQQLDKESQRHEIEWHWIKGHSGHRENEMADALANEAIDELLKARL